MTAADPGAGWGLVVPVKRLAVAKSRLAGFGGDGRRRLALAFAQDVVRAAVACAAVRRVLVVTDDEQAARSLEVLGAEIRDDRPDAGLNAALEHGVALLRELDDRVAVAALSSDLPALRAQDLAAALSGSAPTADAAAPRRSFVADAAAPRRSFVADAAAPRRSFVADAEGTGTTLLAAACGADLLPAFGPGSAAQHRRSGARELTAAPGLRHDVDTPADLAAALLLGVGPSTTAVLADLGPDAVALAGVRPPAQGTMLR